MTLTLTYTPPLLLPFDKKSNLEIEYLRLCQRKEYKGSEEEKQRQKQADKHRQDDLFALLHWRDYKEQKSKTNKEIQTFYNPHEDPPKKILLESLARWHYFFEFCMILCIDLLYVLNFGFTLDCLFFLVPISILTLIITICFIINVICILRVRTHYDALELNKYVILRMGEPGTGKSSSGIYDAVIIAEKLWQDLKFEYWTIKNKIDKIYNGTHLEHTVTGFDENNKPIVEYKRIYTGNEDKIKHIIEIVEAYEYYSEHNTVPCLWSNISIMVNGKFVNKFTADHLLQKKKVLYKGIAFIDEIGSMLPPELSNNKIQDIDLNFRFTRQFKDFRIISTEQDGNATLISARRVTAENKRMIDQKHILKPFILNLIFNLLKNKFEQKEPTDKKVKFILNLKKYINSIGFRRFKYMDFGNLQVGNKGGNGSRIKSFIASPNLNCSYDDRTFKNLYKSKEQATNVEQYTNLILTEQEISDLFNQAIIERSYKTKKSS